MAATTTVTPTRVGIIEADVSRHDKAIGEIESWLDGNGQPGARTRLALLEKGQKEIVEALDGMRKAAYGLVATVIGSLIIFFLLQVIPHVAK